MQLDAHPSHALSQTNFDGRVSERVRMGSGGKRRGEWERRREERNRWKGKWRNGEDSGKEGDIMTGEGRERKSIRETRRA